MGKCSLLIVQLGPVVLGKKSVACRKKKKTEARNECLPTVIANPPFHFRASKTLVYISLSSIACRSWRGSWNRLRAGQLSGAPARTLSCLAQATLRTTAALFVD